MDDSPMPFVLGPWHVDPPSNELRGPGGTARLEPKAMGVLVALHARAGEAVSRADLEAAVWPDVVVTEASLTRCISQVRQALGDDPRAPSFIETVPTVGYRMRAAPAGLGERAGRPRRTVWAWGAGVAVALLAVAWWVSRPPPVVVIYRVEVSGDAGELRLAYSDGGGETTEQVRVFPVTREVRAGIPGTYQIRATGAARDTEVQVTATARSSSGVLARGWAMGSVHRPRAARLDVRTSVEVEPRE